MRKNGRLEGQAAIVTGAAQGLGEALARRLDMEGCSVIVADINFDSAKKVAESLTNGIAVQGRQGAKNAAYKRYVRIFASAV
jgi:NAD(P)-dependent dehydrogenase (short-subunit alcohol dehydrogenase family)